MSIAGFAGTPGLTASGAEYLSERGPEGWATHSIYPYQAPPAFPNPLASSTWKGYFSPDLETGIFRALSPIPGVTTPNVAGTANLYLGTGLRAGTPSFQLLSDSPTPLEASEGVPHVQFADASADFSRIALESTDRLTTDAKGLKQKLYEWSGGSAAPGRDPARLRLRRTALRGGALGRRR